MGCVLPQARPAAIVSAVGSPKALWPRCGCGPCGDSSRCRNRRHARQQPQHAAIAPLRRDPRRRHTTGSGGAPTVARRDPAAGHSGQRVVLQGRGSKGLSADYLSVADEQFRTIESTLAVTRGEVSDDAGRRDPI